MIGQLRGTVVERLLDGSCVIDVGGVGYEVFVPIGTLGRLPEAPEVVTLHVHTHAREDALLLYGFATSEDRAAFRTLLGVSNVGPKLALAILGGLDARELAAAVQSQDKLRFRGIAGVGKRTVERILLELKDKTGFATSASIASVARPSGDPVSSARRIETTMISNVVQALIAMGFKPSEAERAASAVEEVAPEPLPFEEWVKKALAHT